MEAYHLHMMRRALTLARRGAGKTAPNPAVGCVIVKNRAVVGEGWHRKAGTPHAEVHALRAAGPHAAGADVYVTLEPCAHFGKTPPCAEALVAAGVARVYVGSVDPNPLVAGKGLDILKRAGIAVEVGILDGECRRLNEPFFKFMATGRPFVILKSAMTLDGKTATSSGDSKWITNEKSRQYVHKVRGMVDAVMVGVDTVVADDPQLTCRTCRGRNPIRIVVDSNLRTPPNAQILVQPLSARTIIATTVAGGEKAAFLRACGAEILPCAAKSERVDLFDLFGQLGKMGIQSVLVEGGATLAGEVVRSGFPDKYLLFYAPKLVAGEGAGAFAGRGVDRIADTIGLGNITTRRFGSDILMEAYPEASCSPA